MATPHNHLLLSLPLLLPVLLFSPCLTHAQQPFNPSQPSPHPHINTRFNGTTIVMIAILLTVFLFTGMFFLYIHKRQNSSSSNNSDDNTRANTAGSRSRRIVANGLDPAVIESFPLIVYSDVKGLNIGNEALECAVCLCEFEDEENLTMLPKCSHAFHPNCIGMWLTSHSTCPVCRDNLRDPEPGEPVVTSTGGGGGEAEREDQVVVRVDDREEQDVAVELERVGSVRDRLMRSWRSWSARAAVGGSLRMRGNKVWGEEDRDRFTLRLPENVRKELMQSGSSLRRSATVTAFRFNTGEESLRMGYREGTSFRMGRTVRAARSDRWASLRLPSSSFKAGVVGAIDCLGGAGRKVDGASGADGDDMSTVALTRP